MTIDTDPQKFMDEYTESKEVFSPHESDSKDNLDQETGNPTEFLPEAPVVWFTNYENPDGYEESITLRGWNIKEIYEKRQKVLSILRNNNCKPVIRGKKSYNKSEPEKTGNPCPMCGSDVIKGSTKDGRGFEKCSTQKYDFATRTKSGCDYFKWAN